MSLAHDTDNQITLGPYDSLRDYITALEAKGRLLRIPELDQDEYEATALCYRLIEKLGHEKAPAVLVDRVKQDGVWRDGPVVYNAYGSWQDEAITFGIDLDTDNEQELYHAVIGALGKRLGSGGSWGRVAPVTATQPAPVKEVIVTGDDIDITQYAFVKNNPADADRFLNMGSVFLHDDEIGPNMGTYRCQLKGPRKIGVSPSPGQHGWQILMAKKRRGETIAKCSVALAPDPITFAVSSNKMAGLGDDELEIAGAIRGRPVELVKSETNDLMVPAHAEMIVEGEIPLDAFEDEGPYGELYGYLGDKVPATFFMNITAITHRKKPWIANSVTGVTPDMPKAPQIASEFYRYKKQIPNLTALYTPRGTISVVALSIDKKMPGEGIMAGQVVASNPALSKVVIVVDKDINVLNPTSILHALGARWQPVNSVITPQTMLYIPDPSAPVSRMSSKIVIDATRQFPEEGGPKEFPAVSRILLEEGAPDAFARIDDKWSDFFPNGSAR